MNWKKAIGPAALAGYAGAIYAANYVTNEFGSVALAFGMHATAGTIFAGAALMLRSVIQDRYGRLRVFLAIFSGAALSFLTSPALAMASAAAFWLSELADMGVYTPLRRHGWVRAVLPASFVGAVLDTVVFLTLAGFPLVANMPGQMVGKYAATLLPVTVVAAVRAYRARG